MNVVREFNKRCPAFTERYDFVFFDVWKEIDVAPVAVVSFSDSLNLEVDFDFQVQGLSAVRAYVSEQVRG